MANHRIHPGELPEPLWSGFSQCLSSICQGDSRHSGAPTKAGSPFSTAEWLFNPPTGCDVALRRLRADLRLTAATAVMLTTRGGRGTRPGCAPAGRSPSGSGPIATSPRSADPHLQGCQPHVGGVVGSDMTCWSAAPERGEFGMIRSRSAVSERCRPSLRFVDVCVQRDALSIRRSRAAPCASSPRGVGVTPGDPSAGIATFGSMPNTA